MAGASPSRHRALGVLAGLAPLLAAPAGPAPAPEDPPLAELKRQLVGVSDPGGVEAFDRAVREQYRELRAQLDEAMADPEASPQLLSRAWGRLGTWAQAYWLSDMALAAYHNARLLGPHDRRWPYYEAHVNRRLGRLDAAREGFRVVHERRPEELVPLVWLGEVELESGRLEEALAWARAALAADPRCAQALLLVGRIALLREQYDEAVIQLRDAAAMHRTSSRIRYALGLALRGAGDEDARMALYRASLASRRGEERLLRDPLLSRLESLNVGAKRWLRQAAAARRAGRHDRAIAAYVEAVEAAPERVAVRESLASALLELGRTDEAIGQFQWIAERAPDRVSSWFGLGVAYERAGRRQDAITTLERGLAVADDSARTHFKLGTLLAAEGREGEALEAYARAIALAPYEPAFRVERATLLLEQARYGDAAAALEADLTALPDGTGLHLLRARLLASAPDGALRDGARSLELARDGSPRPTVLAAETLAMAYAETGDFERAIAWQKAALAATRERDGVAERMGWVERRLALYEQHRPCREPWVEGERLAVRVRVSPPSG